MYKNIVFLGFCGIHQFAVSSHVIAPFLSTLTLSGAIHSFRAQHLQHIAAQGDGRPLIVAPCAPTPAHLAGQTFRPQTGNVMSKGSAPKCITCKLSDLEWLEYDAQINPDTGSPSSGLSTMHISTRMLVARGTLRPL